MLSLCSQRIAIQAIMHLLRVILCFNCTITNEIFTVFYASRNEAVAPGKLAGCGMPHHVIPESRDCLRRLRRKSLRHHSSCADTRLSMLRGLCQNLFQHTLYRPCLSRLPIRADVLAPNKATLTVRRWKRTSAAEQFQARKSQLRVPKFDMETE